MAISALTSTTAFRWALCIAGGFTAMAFALFGFIYWQTAAHEAQRIDAIVAREAAVIAAAPQDGALQELKAWLAHDEHDVRYAGLYSSDGRVLGGNMPAAPADLPQDGQAHQAALVGIDNDHDGDDPEIVRAAAVRLGNDQLVVIGYDIDELEDVERLMMRALGLGVLPAIALSLLGGCILSLRAQSRIATVHSAVQRVMLGQLGERLPVRGSGDDFDRLAAAVNGMLGEIERLVGEVRGIGDNIAHDLRTPLMRVRTKLERGREEARSVEEFRDCIDRVIGSVDQALAVVSAVLRIGEIEHGRRRAGFTAVDLADVAREAFELYEPLAEDKGVLLRLQTSEAIPVLGDGDLLLEAVGNLLDNAFKFAPPGTEVRLGAVSSAGRGTLCVADAGPGIPEAERGRVLRRFFRGEKSRTVNGSGLGLNLVSAIVALHGFELVIADANPGCSVAILAPRASPNAALHAVRPRVPDVAKSGSSADASSFDVEA